MSRVILFVAFVALAVCCASPVAADEHGCPDNLVWEQCPNVCSTRCPNAIPAGHDCGVIGCHGACVCKPGYLLSKDGFCLLPAACE